MRRRREGLIVAGPTGSGKSAFALAYAQREGGVILNADSLQLYAGLPLLTAQPSPEEQRKAPHFLYEIFPPDGPLCSAAHWCALVKETLETQCPKDALPIIVGGTGFYLQALTRGLSPIPTIPLAIREMVDAIPLQEAHKKLEHIDPQAAQRILPQDRQRVVRALSVWRATGKTLTYWQSLPRVPFPYTFRIHVIMPPRNVLLQQLEKRLAHMVNCGVFDEVKQLLTTLPPSQWHQAPITRALGFDEIRCFWQGVLTRPEAIQKILEKTRQYAKRQVTWLRHQVFFEPTK